MKGLDEENDSLQNEIIILFVVLISLVIVMGLYCWKKNSKGGHERNPGYFGGMNVTTSSDH